MTLWLIIWRRLFAAHFTFPVGPENTGNTKAGKEACKIRSYFHFRFSFMSVNNKFGVGRSYDRL